MQSNNNSLKALLRFYSVKGEESPQQLCNNMCSQLLGKAVRKEVNVCTVPRIMHVMYVQ